MTNITTINWCKESIPELFTFNKMYQLRHGNVPIKKIFLQGKKEDVSYVIKKQKECQVLVDYIENTENIAHYITITVPENVAEFDFSSYIYTLGFDGIFESNMILNSQNLHILLADNQNQKSKLINLIKEDVTLAANNTLMEHFKYFEDNLLHFPNDIKWIKDDSVTVTIVEKTNNATVNNSEDMIVSESIAPSESVSEKAAESTSEINSTEPILEPNKSISASENEPADSNTNEQEYTKPKENTEKRTSKNPIFGKLKQAKKKEETEQKTAKSAKEEVNSLVPEPEEIEAGTFNNKKEVLTEDDKANNEKLLNEIKQVYDECIDFIDKTCNQSYRIILNKMQECNDNKRYDIQFCPMYLEMSDDLKSELYHRLYKLDNLTRQYNEMLIHQVVKIGCWNCGKNWEEDITFVKPGQQYVKCPHCFAERQFHKE